MQAPSPQNMQHRDSLPRPHGDEDGPPGTFVIGLFRGAQARPTLVLLSSCVLSVAWKYVGSAEFYATHLAPRLVLWDDPAATGVVYSMVACFVLLGLVPAMLVKLVFRQRLGEYGVTLGDRRRTLRSAAILVPVFASIGFFTARDPAFAAVYPLNPIAAKMFALHGLAYLLFYLGWEFHFRGFLQMGLRTPLGAGNALLVQVLASTLMHLGKPGAETFGAILGGLLWGALAYRTRSLASGLAQHYALGMSLDWFLCRR